MLCLQNENKDYTTRFFLVDTVSGVSSSASASASSSTFNSLNKNDIEKAAGTGKLGLLSKENEEIISKEERKLPEIIRYLKRMEVK